jgi:hypothetical protein
MIVPFSVVVLVDFALLFQHGEIGSYLPVAVVVLVALDGRLSNKYRRNGVTYRVFPRVPEKRSTFNGHLTDVPMTSPHHLFSLLQYYSAIGFCFPYFLKIGMWDCSKPIVPTLYLI